MTLEDVKKAAEPACKAFKVKKLGLFGSLARGEGTPQSDVDLFTVSSLRNPYFCRSVIEERVNIYDGFSGLFS